ncbi:MAG TPA: MFS transporter [Candidatus Paceibacterota bacterium]
MPEERTLGHKRLIMYAVGFFFSLSAAIPTYVSSSYLSGFIGDRLAGIIYTAASLIAVAAFVEMPAAIRRFGALRTGLVLIGLELASIGALTMGIDALSVIAGFMLNFVTISLLNFVIDLILESFSTNSHTGKIRGSYLSIVNIAWLISPLLAAKILDLGSFPAIYAISGVLLVPVTALCLLAFRSVRGPELSRVPFWKSFGEVWGNRDLKAVLMIQLLLQFFYAWMIIYTPLYLRDTVGFSWEEIGTIFTFMLLPFAMIEAPMGRLADRIGEKSIMSVGFGIMGMATCLISFVTDHDPFIWSLLLFMTRVGAAMVEVMADTFFFKKVDASSASAISFFRSARPLAYVISPIAATILLVFLDMKGLFIALGILMLYGLRYAFSIKDA